MKKEEIFKIGYPAKVAHQPFWEYVSRYANTHDRILDVGGGEGSHSVKLQDMGFKMVCVDINPDYIKVSQQKGVESHVMDATALDYADNSFDLVLLFEVLEHVENFEDILKEAKRVAKKYVLITVPNSGDFKDLEPYLTYDHFLAKDHVNFFSKDDIEDILSKYFEKFVVEKGEPIVKVVGAPKFLNYLLIGLHRLKLLRSNNFYRLYAVAEV
jgi:ubiquinone/menaquinone biosynthesis C-methylase UbiE